MLDPEQVADDMSESDFSEIKWSMEMDALWYGSEDGAFFDFPTISKNRTIKYPMLPDEIASKLNNSQNIRIQERNNGEVRVLSADIALMSSRKNNNDATAIFINQMKPSKAGRYSSNIVYADACEGMRTDEQALYIRKLYEDYKCDYIVLDTNGLGLGVYDALARDMVNPDTGELYPALSCCNNAEMASRCTVVGAKKAIWSIKQALSLTQTVHLCSVKHSEVDECVFSLLSMMQKNILLKSGGTTLFLILTRWRYSFRIFIRHCLSMNLRNSCMRSLEAKSKSQNVLECVRIDTQVFHTTTM